MSGVLFENITAEMPIIGFTGALGSGCSFLGEWLRDHHRYAYCSLSDPIHSELRQAGLPETSENLQNHGDKLRRERGLDYLVRATLAQIDKKLREQTQQGSPKAAGLVVDGIRNTAEVTALRAFPHFSLISVQADQAKRMARVIAKGDRCKDNREFLTADARDAEEQEIWGAASQKVIG